MATVARLTIQVSANTAGATARLQALNQRLNALGRDARGTAVNLNRLDDSVRRLTRSGNNTNNTINRVNQGMRSGTRNSNGFQNAINKLTGKGLHLDITLELIYFAIMALAPVIYTAVGAIGALASMLTVAAVGLGAFGGAVFATRKQMDKILIQPLIKEFDAWGKSLESTMKPVYVAWLSALSGKLKLLNPSVNIMADYMTKAGKAMDKFLGGNQFKSWLDDINKSMKTIMPNLGSFLGDFLVGFLELMRAFLPLAEKMSGKLKQMGASFRNWAENLDSNKAFQDFIKDMEEMGPKVANAFKRVGQAVWSLVQNLSPIGIEILELTARFSKFIAEADPETIKKIAIAFLGLMIIGRITSLINGMVMAFTSMGALMNPITAVILAVVAGFVMAYKHSAKLRDRVEGLKEAFGRFIKSLEPFLPVAQKLFEGFRAFVTFWAETCVLAWTIVFNVMAAFFEWVVPASKTAWDWVVKHAVAFKDWIVNTFNSIKDGIVDAWNATWDYLAPKVEAVWNFIVGVVKAGWAWCVTAFETGKAIVLAVWNVLWTVLSTVAKAAFMVIAGVVMAGWWVISGIFDVFYTIISSVFRILWEVLLTIVTIVWELIKGVIEIALWAIIALFSFVAGVIVGLWDNLWELVSMIVTAVWDFIGPYVMAALDGIKRGIEVAWGFISSVSKVMWEGIKNGIKVVWDFIVNNAKIFWSTLSRGFEIAWEFIKSITVTQWNLIKDGVKAAWDFIEKYIIGGIKWVGDKIAAGWKIVQTTTDRTWNAVKNKVTEITDAIVKGIQDFREDAVGTIRKAKDRIVGVFKGAAEWLYEAGKDVIRGLGNGIKAMGKWVVDKAKGVVKGAVDGAKSLLGISSPSKVFFEIGAWTTEGFANGITDQIPTASASVDRLVRHSVGLMPSPSSFSGTAPQTGPTATAQSGGDTYHFHFDGAIITGGEKQIENMVVNAVKEASRKGRLRNVTGNSI